VSLTESINPFDRRFLCVIECLLNVIFSAFKKIERPVLRVLRTRALESSEKRMRISS